MRADRGTGGEAFLDDYGALEGAALMPAVLLRPGHAEIAGLAHGPAETAIIAVPVVAALARRAVLQLLVKEGAELGAQGDNRVGVSRRGGKGNCAHSAVTIGQ